MAMYTHAARTTTTTSGVAIWALRSHTSQGRIRLRELGIFMAAATASIFGLGRPAAVGITPTAAVVGQAEDTADAVAVGNTAVAWGTAPTAPTSAIYLRRISLPAAIGSGIIWTWPDGPGLIIPVGPQELVIYNLQLNGVVDVYARWEE